MSLALPLFMYSETPSPQNGRWPQRIHESQHALGCKQKLLVDTNEVKGEDAAVGIDGQVIYGQPFQPIAYRTSSFSITAFKTFCQNLMWAGGWRRRCEMWKFSEKYKNGLVLWPMDIFISKFSHPGLNNAFKMDIVLAQQFHYVTTLQLSKLDNHSLE